MTHFEQLDALSGERWCTTFFGGQELQNTPATGGTGINRENFMPLSAPPKIDRYFFEFLQPVDMRYIDRRNSTPCKMASEDMNNIIKDGVHNLLDQDGKLSETVHLGRIRLANCVSDNRYLIHLYLVFDRFCEIGLHDFRG